MEIILFTGLSASGKSTISKSVSDHFDVPRIDIHSIIHKIATYYGHERARDWITSVGTDIALNETASKLVQEIKINKNHQGLIVDEVLDLETFSLLKKTFNNDSFSIVHIATNQCDRERFMQYRLGGSKPEAKKEIHFIDGLKHFVGIQEIISLADYQFNNIGTLSDITNKIQITLEQELHFKRIESSIRKERE